MQWCKSRAILLLLLSAVSCAGALATEPAENRGVELKIDRIIVLPDSVLFAFHVSNHTDEPVMPYWGSFRGPFYGNWGELEVVGPTDRSTCYWPSVPPHQNYPFVMESRGDSFDIAWLPRGFHAGRLPSQLRYEFSYGFRVPDGDWGVGREKPRMLEYFDAPVSGTAEVIDLRVMPTLGLAARLGTVILLVLVSIRIGQLIARWPAAAKPATLWGRLRRWGWHALAGLSLLLCVLVAIGWFHRAGSYRNRRMPFPSLGSHLTLNESWFSLFWGHGCNVSYLHFDLGPNGFRFGNQTDGAFVQLPYWGAVSMTSVLPLLWLFRRWGDGRRAAHSGRGFPVCVPDGGASCQPTGHDT